MTAENISGETAGRPVIGITIGDPAGVGPEVVQGALRSGALPAGFGYRLIGQTASGVIPGKPSPEAASIAWSALEEGACRTLSGELHAVVTGPVCKHSLYGAGFPFPGQTEFFAARCGVSDFAMLLTGGTLTVALVTAHLPLAEAVRSLSATEIVRVGRLLAGFLRGRLGRSPRIAVAGLNPHAGERGSLGREEIDVITPAVERLQQEFLEAGGVFHGPVSPDTVFHQAAAGTWDGVLCMYHDQGLIPLKLHAFDQGVNVTIGLPIIRTSPDHGTAFEIAGRGVARPDSMIAAIRLATELVSRREPGTPPL